MKTEIHGLLSIQLTFRHIVTLHRKVRGHPVSHDTGVFYLEPIGVKMIIGLLARLIK